MTGKDKSDRAAKQQRAEKDEKDDELEQELEELLPGERSAVDDAAERDGGRAGPQRPEAESKIRRGPDPAFSRFGSWAIMGSPNLSQIECAPARDVRRGGRCCLAFSFYKKNAISYAGARQAAIEGLSPREPH